MPDLLVLQGFATSGQITEALKRQEETGVFFGDALEEMGVLSEKTLVGFLAKYCKVPHLSLLDYVVDKEAVALVPGDLCWKYHLLPIDKMGRNLTVAMVNPLNQQAMNAVSEKCPGMRIKPILCSHKDFETVAGRFFGEHLGHDERYWSQVDVTLSQRDKETLTEGGSVSAADAPPVPEPEISLPAPDVSILINDKFVDNVFFDEDDKVAAAMNDLAQAAPSIFRKMDSQARADEIVKSFTSYDDLLNQYTEMMMQSMRNSYELLSRKIPFFHGIEAREVAKFFSHGKIHPYEFGQTVYHKGDISAEMYIILNGCVELQSGEGDTVTLRRGDVFGETALIGGEVRNETAVVIARSSLMAVDFETIRNVFSPEVATRLLANIIVIIGRRLDSARLGLDTGDCPDLIGKDGQDIQDQGMLWR